MRQRSTLPRILLLASALGSVLIATTAHASPTEAWTAITGVASDAMTDLGFGLSSKRAMAVDAQGNTFVTGSGNSQDFLTQKFDSAGNWVWTARYDGPSGGSDYGVALALDGAGNVAVTGGSSGDYATVKYAGDTGETLWVTRYNGPGNGNDVPRAVTIDASGNVFVTGQSLGLGPSNNYATVKYSGGTGAELWVARYVGPMGFDSANAIVVDNSGDVIITGASSGRLSPQNSDDFDYATVKYAGDTGSELWVQRYDGSFTDRAYDLAVDGSGDVVVTGQSNGGNATVKYASATGQEMWTASFSASGGIARAVVVDSVGNVVVTGGLIGSPSRGVTEKYAKDTGNRLWSAIYDESGESTNLYSLALDSVGDVVVTGTSYVALSTPRQTTFRYAGVDGTPLWRHRLTVGNGVAVAVAVSSDDSIRIGGELEVTPGDRATVVRLDEWTGFKDGFESPGAPPG